MAYADDPDQREMYNRWTSARRTARVRRTGQTLGALSETLRTGRSGTVAKRDADHGLWSQSDKLKATQVILTALEGSERDIWKRELDYTETIAREKAATERAIINAEASLVKARGQVGSAKAATSLRRFDSVGRREATERERMLNGSKTTGTAVGDLLTARNNPEIRLAVERQALADARATAADKDFKSPDSEASFIERAAKKGESSMYQDLLQGRDIAGVPGTAEVFRQSVIAGGVGLLEGLPQSGVGEMAVAARLLAAGMGMERDAMLRNMSPNVADAVLNDELNANAKMNKNRQDLDKAQVEMDSDISSMGVGDIDGTLEAAKAAMDSEWQAIAASTEAAAEAVAGGPEGDLGAGPESSQEGGALGAAERTGTPGEGGDPEPPLEGAPAAWNLDNPVHRAHKSMGAKHPPPDNAAGQLEALIQRIEQMPELPPVQEAKQALLQSQQFSAYKDKNGYTDDTVAFREFARDMRLGKKKSRQDSERIAMKKRRTGESARGPWSIHAGEKHAGPKAAKKVRTPPSPVTGASIGPEE